MFSGLFNFLIIVILVIICVLVCAPVFVVDGYQDVKKYPWTPPEHDGCDPFNGEQWCSNRYLLEDTIPDFKAPLTGHDSGSDEDHNGGNVPPLFSFASPLLLEEAGSGVPAPCIQAKPEVPRNEAPLTEHDAESDEEHIGDNWPPLSPFALPLDEAGSVVPQQCIQVAPEVTEDPITKFGIPTNQLIREPNFIVQYDYAKKIYRWVQERLTPDMIGPNGQVIRGTYFKNHTSIHPLFWPHASDYRKSGKEKGHGASAGNHKDSQANHNATNIYQNAAPQVGKHFNGFGGAWFNLENHIRDQLKGGVYVEMHIFTVALFLPHNGDRFVKYEVIGAGNVAVPTDFGKVTLGVTPDGFLELCAYILPNMPLPGTKPPFTEFMVNPWDVEEFGGVLIFENLDRRKLRKINGDDNVHQVYRQWRDTKPRRGERRNKDMYLFDKTIGKFRHTSGVNKKIKKSKNISSTKMKEQLCRFLAS